MMLQKILKKQSHKGSIEIDRVIEARMEGWNDRDGILEKIKLLKQKRSENLAAKEKLHCYAHVRRTYQDQSSLTALRQQ